MVCLAYNNYLEFSFSSMVTLALIKVPWSRVRVGDTRSFTGGRSRTRRAHCLQKHSQVTNARASLL